MSNLKPELFDNEVYIEFMSDSVNEGLARMIVSAFILPLNPNMEEMADLKTAVSEAVTNTVIHAYPESRGVVRMSLSRKGHIVYIDVSDEGCGISDVSRAMEPLFTTREDMDRSGMGFAFMEAFTDELSVESELGKGTVIHMQKLIGGES